MSKEISQELLHIENLKIELDTPKGCVHAVRGVDLSLYENEILAIAGESGCGKTIFCRSMMGLLPASGRITEGCIVVDGCDITKSSDRELQSIRGNVISMIFQDPMTALNPTMTIGKLLEEAILLHDKISKKEAQQRTHELLELVGLPQPEKIAKMYPHQLSGGMRQRVVIAIALAPRPKILIADEPTTALDVTVQAQILSLLSSLKEKLGMSVVLITHDLSVVASIADRTAIMYAGYIVEYGTTKEVLTDPKHPYTVGLLRTIPSRGRNHEVLYTIPGMPPSLIDPPKGDAFAQRNPEALPRDFEEMPPMFKISDSHYAASWLLSEQRGLLHE